MGGRGGGIDRAVWGGGGGFLEKGSIDRYHQSVIINFGAKGAENFFDH